MKLRVDIRKLVNWVHSSWDGESGTFKKHFRSKEVQDKVKAQLDKFINAPYDKLRINFEEREAVVVFPPSFSREQVFIVSDRLVTYSMFNHVEGV